MIDPLGATLAPVTERRLRLAAGRATSAAAAAANAAHPSRTHGAAGLLRPLAQQLVALARSGPVTSQVAWRLAIRHALADAWASQGLSDLALDRLADQVLAQMEADAAIHDRLHALGRALLARVPAAPQRP